MFFIIIITAKLAPKDVALVLSSKNENRGIETKFVKALFERFYFSNAVTRLGLVSPSIFTGQSAILQPLTGQLDKEQIIRILGSFPKDREHEKYLKHALENTIPQLFANDKSNDARSTTHKVVFIFVDSQPSTKASAQVYTNGLKALHFQGIRPVLLTTDSTIFNSVKELVSTLPSKTETRVVLLDNESELKDIVGLLDSIKQGMILCTYFLSLLARFIYLKP